MPSYGEMSTSERDDVFCRLLNNQCFKVNNLKVRFKAPLKLTRRLDVIYQQLSETGKIKFGGRSHNFITFKLNSFTYTLFDTGHINLTGLRQEKDVSKSVYMLRDLIPEEFGSQCPDQIPIVLDNLSASGRLIKRGRRCAYLKRKFTQVLERFCRAHSLLEWSWNPELFSGYTIRTPHGSLVVFPTGSVNILGVKKFHHCEFFQGLLDNLLCFV